MASYTELNQQFTDAQLNAKVTTAAIVGATNLLVGTPTLNDQKFAYDVFSDPDAIGHRLLLYVLAANKDLTIAQIKNATDAAIQTQVDAAIVNFVAASYG